MKEYFELDPREKKQEWLLLTLTILFVLIIAMGVYFQTHNKDHDDILVPSFFITASCIFLVYAINAFEKGNLVKKGTPAYIFKPLLFFAKRLRVSTADKAEPFVIKFLGIVGLIASIGLFIMAIILILQNSSPFFHSTQAVK